MWPRSPAPGPHPGHCGPYSQPTPCLRRGEQEGPHTRDLEPAEHSSARVQPVMKFLLEEALLASLQGYVITSPWQDLPGQLALGQEIQPLYLWTHSIGLLACAQGADGWQKGSGQNLVPRTQRSVSVSLDHLDHSLSVRCVPGTGWEPLKHQFTIPPQHGGWGACFPGPTKRPA